jgi:guanine nucleotide-binding protein subunit alpha
MGCCLSVEQVEGKERNKEIDTQIKRDRINMRKEIKMLLLGKQFPPLFFLL